MFCPDCWRDLHDVINVPNERTRKRQELFDAIVGYNQVVINRCHGGFGLSHTAKIRYLEMCGKQYTLKSTRDRDYHSRWGPDIEVGGVMWTEYDIPRDDPYLVNVVEELGEGASGPLSKLKVVDVPVGVEWVVSEYDGLEWVAEHHRVWV